MEIARTGSEALSKARTSQPVAILLDIVLPELDGWEVLARLKTPDMYHLMSTRPEPSSSTS